MLMLLELLQLSLLLREKKSHFATSQGLPLVFLLFFPLRIGWALAAQLAHVRRTCTGEVENACHLCVFQDQPGPGACNDAVQVLCQEEYGSLSKSGRWWVVLLFFVCS